MPVASSPWGGRKRPGEGKDRSSSRRRRSAGRAPVGNSGVYSALLIARRAFDKRRRLAAEIAGLEARIAERRAVVRAVMALGEGADEDRAYGRLRALAMSWQVTIEEAARRVNALKTGEDSHERPARA